MAYAAATYAALSETLPSSVQATQTRHAAMPVAEFSRTAARFFGVYARFCEGEQCSCNRPGGRKCVCKRGKIPASVTGLGLQRCFPSETCAADGYMPLSCFPSSI